MCRCKCLRFGNYYGIGWSGGEYHNANMTIDEYIELLRRVPAIDNQLDRIARYHDIGLYMAGLSGSEISAQQINWCAAKWFWRCGTGRGYFGSIGLFLGSITFAVNCYVGFTKREVTETQLEILHELLMASAQAVQDAWTNR